MRTSHFDTSFSWTLSKVCLFCMFLCSCCLRHGIQLPAVQVYRSCFELLTFVTRNHSSEEHWLGIGVNLVSIYIKSNVGTLIYTRLVYCCKKRTGYFIIVQMLQASTVIIRSSSTKSLYGSLEVFVMVNDLASRLCFRQLFHEARTYLLFVSF